LGPNCLEFDRCGGLFPRVKWPLSEDHLYLHPVLRMSVATPSLHHTPSRLPQGHLSIYLSSKQRVGLGLFCTMAQQPQWAKASSLSRMHDHTQLRDTPHSVGFLWTSASYVDGPLFILGAFVTLSLKYLRRLTCEFVSHQLHGTQSFVIS
jgi:hypothetical protein